MATKTLNTRIQLKYDTYANWTSKNPVLLAGEIAVATLDSTVTTQSGVGNPNANIPNVVLKVGDGTTAYNSLKFVSGLAADVYAWAKAETKPSYTAEEIEGLSNYIAGEIEDTDTQYTIEKDGVNGLILKSKSKGSSTYDTTVASISFSDLATKTEVQAVQTALDEAVAEGGAVDTRIAANNAILKMDEVSAGTGEVISKVSQTNGIVSVSKKTLTAADIPTLEISKTNGLQDALDSKQDVLAAIDGEVTVANPVATKSTVNTAISDNNAALANNDAAVANQFVTAAVQSNGIVTVSRSTITENSITGEISQSKITGLTTALAGKQDNLTFAGDYSASNPVTTQSYVDEQIADVVADINGAMHFIGTVEKDPTTNTADENSSYIAGDVVVYGIVEYVYNGQGTWIQLGEEGIYKLKDEYNTEKAALEADITALESNKQDNLTFDGTYNASTNKVATVSTAQNAAADAIAALDVAEVSFGTGKVLSTIKQEDGFVSVTSRDLVEADIPALSEGKISGLTTKLNTIQSTLDAIPEGSTVATKTYVGEEITSAIGALDGGNTEADLAYVSEVKQTDGVISVKTKTLAKIAETGNVNDLVQTSGDYLIFNCGSASVNI